MKINVIEKIVNHSLCIGCGVCAGICPANALKMKFNDFGEYNPVERAACLDRCRLCIEACPFGDRAENEDTFARVDFANIDRIAHRFETGYYLDSCAGYSNVNDHRANGASGGMATWMLESLLIKNIVDYIVCVTPYNDSDNLFQFALFSDIESIRRSARSAYYPVEMSKIIQAIIKKKGRYAIIGLPCFLKGIRLAAEKNKKLKDRIGVKIGLVCGQMKSKNYTAYLASLAGVNGKLKAVNYRGKSAQKPASNYFFYCVDYKNTKGRLFWDEGVKKAWVNRWFTPMPCNFCDDVFAELADVTVMDAWLPEYSQDFKGTNLLIIRTPAIGKLLEEGKKRGHVSLKDIAIGKIVQSQRGVINIKKSQIAYRLHRAKMKGLTIPAKRVASSKDVTFWVKKEIELKDKMQTQSRESSLRFDHNQKIDLKVFLTEMEPQIKALNRWHRMRGFLEKPKRAVKKLKRLIPGAQI